MEEAETLEDARRGYTKMKCKRNKKGKCVKKYGVHRLVTAPFLIAEVMFFGLLLGIPFLVSGKTFLQYLLTLKWYMIIVMVLASFAVGFVIERWGRDLLRGGER